MEYKKYNCNSYNIHTIKTDKFKTVRMEIIFSREVAKEEMPIFTFLSDILTDSGKNYKSRRDIAIKLEELYKATFYGTSSKVGNLFTASFILEFIAPNYINEEGYLEEVLKFPFEVINNPRVKNKEFDLTNFNIIKKRVLEEIDSIIENSDRLALIKSLEKMDNNSPSSFKVLGSREDINNITPSSLYDAYLELLNHSNCDIYIIGNINMEEAVNIIKTNFKNRVIKLKNISLKVNNKVRRKAQIVVEKSTFVQSTLVMIYNINNLAEEYKDSAFHVFNYLLCSGGISSKLYQYLRCDNALCYAVRSLYLKYDGLFIIEVSLDQKNVKLAQNLIKKSIKEMIKAQFSSELVEDAKKNLIISLQMSSDNNVSILNNYIFHTFSNLPLIDERIKALKKVEKKDIMACGKSLVLNTVYIQEAGEIDARN